MKEKTLSLLELSRLHFLISQRIYRYIQSDEYKLAETKMSEDEKVKIRKYIQVQDIKPIRTIVERLLEKNYEDMPVMKLRALAKNKRIKYYTTFTRWQLIKELLEIDKARSDCTSSEDGVVNTS